MAVLPYPVLGLSVESSIWLSFYSAIGEFYYHMNISTPVWTGYFFQRPENHRLHHIQNKRFCQNYADLPIWDWLGGTFQNVQTMKQPTVYPTEKEVQIFKIIFFRDLLKTKKVKSWTKIFYKVVAILVVCVGLIQTVGYVFQLANLRGIGFVSGVSPLPLVFSSFNGVETFSTDFKLSVQLKNSTVIEIDSINQIYSKIDGPYNRRNVYRAMFSYGPFFNTVESIRLRDQILFYGICRGGLKLDLNNHLIQKVTVNIRPKTVE